MNSARLATNGAPGTTITTVLPPEVLYPRALLNLSRPALWRPAGHGRLTVCLSATPGEGRKREQRSDCYEFESGLAMATRGLRHRLKNGGGTPESFCGRSAVSARRSSVAQTPLHLSRMSVRVRWASGHRPKSSCRPW
jgi:hypothetical protein